MCLTDANIVECRAAAYEVPTDAPESDGTLGWDSTTMVIVEVRSKLATGIGYSYTDRTTAGLINHKLSGVVVGQPTCAIPSMYNRLVAETRNLGRPGLVSMAISAIDIALWDLRARELGLPLYKLVGEARSQVPVYGSGCFTSYDDRRLVSAVNGWRELGIEMVKMKVGRDPDQDLRRARLVREHLGEGQLFVDANGAYQRKQAVYFAKEYASMGVSWFEEPVSSDDLDGLNLVRDANIPGIEITAGEYGFHSDYFLRMLAADAVDVIQFDATRCCGVTGFLAAASLAAAHHIPCSAHCAPLIHAHLGCSCGNLRHLEYFHDHVRIESIFFDSALSLRDGCLVPDPSAPGLGVEIKQADVERYQV